MLGCPLLVELHDVRCLGAGVFQSLQIPGAWVLVTAGATSTRIWTHHANKNLYVSITPMLGCLGACYFSETTFLFIRNSQAPKHPPSCCLKLLAGVGIPLARRVLVKVLVHKHPSARHENLTYYMAMFTYTA